ncbi:hypothetical protein DdX_19623 [Ditylenchus destructor]|uniref:Uncharacterized protein n=1 Tax=Ditylenchus destructor TaxID=166010 RepID=A0AAD4MJD4_9BILA|nr:hypothetical protein DdX_19623 [Ditylenchus destructor]
MRFGNILGKATIILIIISTLGWLLMFLDPQIYFHDFRRYPIPNGTERIVHLFCVPEDALSTSAINLVFALSRGSNFVLSMAVYIVSFAKLGHFVIYFHVGCQQRDEAKIFTNGRSTTPTWHSDIVTAIFEALAECIQKILWTSFDENTYFTDKGLYSCRLCSLCGKKYIVSMAGLYKNEAEYDGRIEYSENECKIS